mgnify:CR=1 FL=1
MTGNVDKHLIEIFGASTLLTTLPVIPALLQNDNQSANQTQVIEGARDGFNQAAAIALQNSINIAPTITVPQGSEITIFVNRDLSFKGVH